MYYVYTWTNLRNGKRYVGKGKGNRALAHTYANRKGLLADAMRKHGVENFKLDLIEAQLSEPEAHALEIETIAQLGTLVPLGYNRSPGGEGLSSPSEETIAKRVSAWRATMAARDPAVAAAHGARISASKRGIPKTPEEIAKRTATRRANREAALSGKN